MTKKSKKKKFTTLTTTNQTINNTTTGTLLQLPVFISGRDYKKTQDPLYDNEIEYRNTTSRLILDLLLGRYQKDKNIYTVNASSAGSATGGVQAQFQSSASGEGGSTIQRAGTVGGSSFGSGIGAPIPGLFNLEH